MTQPLLIEHDDGVDRVTLNRPDSLNALNPDLIDALNAYFQGLQRNRTTRVVVLKGAGASFCAGLDLKHAMKRRAGQQEPPGVTESLDSQRRIADIVMLMRRCPQPIIALVQGAAAGGGFALALAADIRIATRSARMNCAFIKLGLGGCDIGTSYFLPRLGTDPDRALHRRRARACHGPRFRGGRGRRARRGGRALHRGDDDGLARRPAAVEGMPQYERRCRLARGRDRDGRPQPDPVQPLGRIQRGHQGLS
jgi:enoyl-CoA hydratase/isomerase-like protein